MVESLPTQIAENTATPNPRPKEMPEGEVTLIINCNRQNVNPGSEKLKNVQTVGSLLGIKVECNDMGDTGKLLVNEESIQAIRDANAQIRGSNVDNSRTAGQTAIFITTQRIGELVYSLATEDTRLKFMQFAEYAHPSALKDIHLKVNGKEITLKNATLNQVMEEIIGDPNRLLKGNYKLAVEFSSDPSGSVPKTPLTPHPKPSKIR